MNRFQLYTITEEDSSESGIEMEFPDPPVRQNSYLRRAITWVRRNIWKYTKLGFHLFYIGCLFAVVICMFKEMAKSKTKSKIANATETVNLTKIDCNATQSCNETIEGIDVIDTDINATNIVNNTLNLCDVFIDGPWRNITKTINCMNISTLEDTESNVELNMTLESNVTAPQLNWTTLEPHPMTIVNGTDIRSNDTFLETNGTTSEINGAVLKRRGEE